MSVLKVLLVDDDKESLICLKMALEMLGHEVVETSDGANAVALFEQVKPDVVITDYGMPEISGIDLLVILKKKSPNVRVILISGNHELDIAVRAMKLGASDYIKKPLSIEHIEAAMQAAQAEKNKELRSLEETEKSKIMQVIRNTETLKEAAEILGIATETLWRKRKEYGIKDEKKKIA